MIIGLHVKYPLFLLDFNSLIFSTDFQEYPDIKFREKSSNGCRVMRTDGETDIGRQFCEDSRKGRGV